MTCDFKLTEVRKANTYYAMKLNDGQSVELCYLTHSLPYVLDTGLYFSFLSYDLCWLELGSCFIL